MATVLVPTLVQAGVAGSAFSGGAWSVAVTVVNAGDTLVLSLSVGTAAAAASAVSGAGATWYRLTTLSGGSLGADLWVGLGAAAGAQTVSITSPAAEAGAIIDEWRYLDQSALINESTLGAVGSGSTGIGPGTFAPADASAVLYGAAVIEGVPTSPAAPWTSSGLIAPGFFWATVSSRVEGSAVGLTPTWTQTLNNPWVSLGVILRAQQPVGYTIFNDPIAAQNAAVVSQQATPDYMDAIITGFASAGTGTVSGGQVLAAVSSGFAVQTLAAKGAINWGPLTMGALASTAISTADATHPRRDLVYTDVTGTAFYLPGQPAVTPCIPLPPSYPWIAQGVIDVPANATVLDPPGTASPNAAHAQITDKRSLIAYAQSGREYYLTTGGFESMSRLDAAVATVAGATTGKETGVAIFLPAGFSVGHLTFVSGTVAAGTPTHYWFALRDSAGNLLAATVDQGGTAWAASSQKTLAIASIAGYASAPSFTTTYSGLYYVSRMMAATTVNTFQGTAVSAVLTSTLTPQVACQMGAATGQTAAPTFPNLAAPGAAIGGTIYATATN